MVVWPGELVGSLFLASFASSYAVFVAFATSFDVVAVSAAASFDAVAAVAGDISRRAGGQGQAREEGAPHSSQRLAHAPIVADWSRLTLGWGRRRTRTSPLLYPAPLFSLFSDARPSFRSFATALLDCSLFNLFLICSFFVHCLI